MDRTERCNLDAVFRAVAATQPAAPAILETAPGADLTYAELDRAIDATAAALAGFGVTPADCVGLHCPSGVAYIVAAYASWRLGVCVVPLPTELSDAEAEVVMRSIRITLVVSADPAAPFARPFFRDGRAEIRPGLWVFRVDGRRKHPLGFEAVNAAFIRFTSGTTGAAKGVVLSHETIRERFVAANDALGIGAGDRVLWVLSMSYHFAVSIAGYLSFGAAIVLPRSHLGRDLVDAAANREATIVYAAPAHIAGMAADPRKTPLPRLRLAISTTAPLRREVGLAFYDRFRLPVVQALGLIEIGLPFINLDFAATRCEAIGRPLPAYQLRLADAGCGPDLREVLLRGPGFLDAYYDPWQPRSEILRDGWFHTGDVGAVDADGCLTLRGRVKDVINVAGMKFFPGEVEEVLTSHPAVAAACVLHEPDRFRGEVPYAVVVLDQDGERTDEERLVAHCRERLASYKVPDRIEFATALPATRNGKVLHRRPRWP